MTKALKKAPVAKSPKAKIASRQATPRGAAQRGGNYSLTTREEIESKGLSKRPPRGYKETSSGIFVPDSPGKPVSPSKFTKGLKSAKSSIQEAISEFSDFITQEMEISEIELSISINAKGEFLGFGVGGDASVKIKIRPSR